MYITSIADRTLNVETQPAALRQVYDVLCARQHALSYNQHARACMINDKEKGRIEATTPRRRERKSPPFFYATTARASLVQVLQRTSLKRDFE